MASPDASRNTFSKRKVVVAVSAFALLLLLVAVWFLNRSTDSSRLMEELAETALPEDTYMIVVAPADDPKWLTTVAGLSGVTDDMLEPLVKDAQWVSYADTPAPKSPRPHYEIVTIGFESSDAAKIMFDEQILAQPDAPVGERFVWRHYGTTVQGVTGAPGDFLKSFPADAPVIDVDFRGAAFRMDATRWANALIRSAPENERATIAKMVESLGVSLDEGNPSVVAGAEKVSGLLEGKSEGWSKGDPMMLNALARLDAVEDCDESGEQCLIHRSRLDEALVDVAVGKVTTDGDVRSMFRLQDPSVLSKNLTAKGNTVGYFSPRGLFAGLSSGANASYLNDFRWFNFAVTPKGTVLLEPHIEAWDE